MTQPTPYNRQANFTDYSSANPSKPHRGDWLDAEFNAIEETADALCANLALIQRDDGRLRNASVALDQLANDVLALIGSQGFKVRGQWLTGTAYALADVVQDNAIVYLCMTAHTSGVLATDVAAQRFVAIFSLGPAVLPADVVTTTAIVDGAVTLPKMAANSVDASKIVDGAVGTAELANGAVTPAKLSVTAAARIYATIGNMTAEPKANLTDGQVAMVMAYQAAGDGGGGFFQWSAASTATADTGNVFASVSGGAGRWTRIGSGIKQTPAFWGARMDRTPAAAGGDDTANFTAYMVDCIARGVNIEIPSVHTRIASALPAITLNFLAAIGKDARVPSIIGQGPSSSIISYEGPGELFDVEIQSSFTPFRVAHLRLQRPNEPAFSTIPAGAALKIGGNFGFVIDDVNVCYFDTGFESNGALSGTFTDCSSYYCLTGMFLYGGTVNGLYNGANQITLIRPSMIACRDYGLRVNNGTNIAVHSIDLETCGDPVNGIKCQPIYLQNIGTEGGVGFRASGASYVEGNFADASVYIVHSAACSYDFTGFSFNRAGVGDVTLYDIVFDANALGPGGPKGILDLRGSGFRGYNGYVPDIAKPRLLFGTNGNTYDGLTVFMDGATGLDGIDAGDRPTAIDFVGRQQRVAANCRFGGASAVLGGKPNNVQSIVRNSVGNYTFTFKRNIGDAVNGFSFEAIGGGVGGYLANEITTSGLVTGITVITYRTDTRAATDTDGFITVYGTAP